MRQNVKIIVEILLLCLIRSPITLAQEKNEPNTVDLVLAVRESENWIHRIDTLQFSAEGKWLHPPESIADRIAELKQQYPDEEPNSERNWELKPGFVDSLEYSIDFKNKLLRYVENVPGKDYFIYVWDGQQTLRYAKDRSGYEQYDIDSTTEMLFVLFGSMSWPEAQPHSFWWKQVDVNKPNYLYSNIDNFTLVGQEIYRGIPCYVLEYKQLREGNSTTLVCKWFVGIEDHLLYGRIEGKNFEFWTLDYKEVASGCKMPMTQGYSVRKENADYVDFQRDLKITEVRINETLQQELFQMKFEEGLSVYDRQTGEFHIHVNTPESLLGKPLPEPRELGNLAVEVNKKMLLVCFFDYEQRPSRNCILELSKRIQELEINDIEIIAVQTSKMEQKILDEWIKENEITLPIGMVQDNEEQTRFNWGVKALPWLILTDKEHIVQAEGFSVAELDEKI